MSETELNRIAAALERMAPAPMAAPDFTSADAFVWHTSPDRLEPVTKVSRVDIGLLIGVDRSRDTLLSNTLPSPRWAWLCRVWHGDQRHRYHR